MLRGAFCLALLSMLVASALVTPVYSLIPRESGPLTAFKLQYPQATDMTTVNALPVDKEIKTDYGAIEIGEMAYHGRPGRTLVYGSGNVAALGSSAHVVGLGGTMENGQPLLGFAVSQSPLPSQIGFSYLADPPLQFDSAEDLLNGPGRLSGSSIIGSDKVAEKYNITGDGVNVAIVDTGTDFSNPDMRHSLARDENGVPIMLDADGQGIVLTKATYVAKIDDNGRVVDAGYTEDHPPDNFTSWVYVNETGKVLLNTSFGDIPTYNSLYPIFGPPVVNATARFDWIIGHSPSDYIHSASGVYHFGVIYQVQQQFGTITFGVVPVLVVDSEEPGVYDTIIPDMYSGWYLYTQNELARLVDRTSEIEHLFGQPAYDFTDDVRIRLGDGNEFLTFDYNGDDFADFSAGTVGARVVDLWQVATNTTKPKVGEGTGYGGVVAADLLEGLDPAGNYFGVMYDVAGHGTSTAATVASKGEQKYDIYANGTKYGLAGIAPGARIIPVKALWAGDSLFGWLYVSGFDLNNGTWIYSGDHKADIVSNSWGVDSFPLLQYGPGYDILSVTSSLLAVPGLLAEDYPGTLFVNSLGNNGLGYGSVGTPNSSPLSISVGATTNNVHVGYNGFQNITRFGNTMSYYDDVADFSSRGPGLLGDPKPELMAIGSYAFTPTIVNLKNLGTTADDSQNDAAFALFGGTSMAAPMVAATAALLIEDLRDQGKELDPFEIKTILMSSAVDLKNDPFVQGAGRVDALAAVNLAEGESGLAAYTEDTVPNILSEMSGAIRSYDKVLGVIEGGREIREKLDAKFPDSRWFAGHVGQGQSASTEIVIENPSAENIDVEVTSALEKLVARYEIHNATRPFERDPVHISTEFGYNPNYYNIDEIGGVPDGAELMVAKVTFPFESFMNATEFYADHLRIASLYAYDWADGDGDGKVTYTETSMVNRGGSWGTVQELRVSDPAEKFKNIPLIGVYPVPMVFSFWQGDRQINSTAMNYTLTVEFYDRQPNPAITLNGAEYGKVRLSLGPESEEKITTTIDVAEETLPGIYYGSLLIEPEDHNATVMPISYVVTSRPVPKDVPVVAVPDMSGKQDLGLRPNGYVGGLFDMTSRYSAGDWRSYYFAVEDGTITAMTLKVSWPHNSTSINAMAFGPDGRMLASSVPSGVFETFAGWPSNDWLGTTSFSEGGAFYFSQNAGENSTVMHIPVNGTGVYSVLLHNTVFHGNSLYEPLQVEAKFSTILPDSAAPAIAVELPKYVGGSREHSIAVAITDENFASSNYEIDDEPFNPDIDDDGRFQILIDTNALAEGMHTLRIDASDLVGHVASFVSAFEVDNTPPVIDIFVQGSSGSMQKVMGNKVGISQESTLLWNITDKNGIMEHINSTSTNNSSKIVYHLSYSETINPVSMADGVYPYSFEGEDASRNYSSRDIEVIVDTTPPAPSLSFPNANPQDLRGAATVVVGSGDPNIHSMFLQVDDRKSVNVTGMHEYQLDTTYLPDGKYELKLVATDIASNEVAIVTPITVANNAPHITAAIVAGLAAGGGIASVAWFVFARRGRNAGQ
jgi:subtilase family protein/Big-like domain-containing protein